MKERWIGPKGKYYQTPNRELEHRVIAERALGSKLPANAVVHHHDGNTFNNENSNLVICEDRGYHAHIHRRMRILAAGADPNLNSNCPTCKLIKPKTAFHKNAGSYDGLNNECKSCVLIKSAKRADRLRGGRPARAYRRKDLQ